MTPHTLDLLVNSPGEIAFVTNNSEPPPVSKELIGKAMAAASRFGPDLLPPA